MAGVGLVTGAATAGELELRPSDESSDSGTMLNTSDSVQVG